jgi:starch synthase
LNWVPDIIHVHGWMAAMLPIYMKHYYKTKRCFLTLKSLLQSTVSLFEGSLDEMINKIKLDGVPLDAISDLESPDYESIIKATIKHSDAVIASDSLSKFNKIYRIFRKTFFTFRAQR